MRGLIFLCAFGVGLASAAERTGAVSSWALADFNGDQTIDVALSRPLGRDSSGYTQQIQIRLGTALPSFFDFHSRSARIQLGTRDIDGDHDIDIFVVEAWSRIPIGVWLNDGSGNFSEGDVSRYQSALDTQNSKSLTTPQTAIDSLLAIIQQDNLPALTLTPIAERERTVEGFAPEGGSGHSTRKAVRIRNRAPPRNA